MSGARGDRRAAVLAREAGRLQGNRLWRVETAQGPALQKYYCEKSGAFKTAWRSALSRVLRGASGTRAETRWRVERELLAVWAGAGLAVPRDLTAAAPALGGERVLLLEFIEGKVLGWVLSEGRLSREERDGLLRRFAAEWGRRHRIALERGDPRLVQVHGSLLHVMVAGERFVTIDLEQTYLPGQPVAPLVAREVLSCLRSLAKAGDEATFRADLAAVVAGYPDRAVLESVVAEYLRSPSLARRLLWGVERALRGGRSPKYTVAGALATALERRGRS